MVLAIGLVVDDAIVVLENIYRNLENGMSRLDAALAGAKEIAFAVVAMTITLAAVYAPLAFATGRTGRLFIEFALALSGAVLVSGLRGPDALADDVLEAPAPRDQAQRHLQRDRGLLPRPHRRTTGARSAWALHHRSGSSRPPRSSRHERRPVQEPALGARAHRGSRRRLQLRLRAGGLHGPLHRRQPQARRGSSTGRFPRCGPSTRWPASRRWPTGSPSCG